MDCFGTYFTHAQSCDNVHVQSATGRTASVHTHAQSCDNVHVQSATDWAASVHTLHMPKAVIKFVFEVYGMDCWRTYLTHAQICDNIRVQSATKWIVFSRFRVFVFSRFRAWRFRVFAFSRFRVPPAASPRPGHRFRVHRKFSGSSKYFLLIFCDLQVFQTLSCHLRKALCDARAQIFRVAVRGVKEGSVWKGHKHVQKIGAHQQKITPQPQQK